MVNRSRLESYMRTCISQSCEAEGRENDVRFWYKILNDELLFAVKTKYIRVRRRIIWRMLHNIPKNFGLVFTLVHPNPIREGREFYERRVYDIIGFTSGIDPNYSIDIWEFDGTKYTIRCAYGNRPDVIATKHLADLKEHGYDYIEDNHDWDKFQNAFMEVYGKTPFELSQILWRERKNGKS